MSIKIQLKHSATKDKAPQASDLSNGELALNINSESPAAYIKDSAGKIIQLAGLTGSATAPAAPAIGDVWVDSSVTPNVIKVWNSATWVAQTGSTVSGTTAPATPATGQLWVDTSVSPNVIKIWDGTAWVTATPSGSDAQAIANDAKYATKAETADKVGEAPIGTSDGTKIYARQVVTTGTGTTPVATTSWVEASSGGGLTDVPDGTAAGTKKYIREAVAVDDGSGGFTTTKDWAEADAPFPEPPDGTAAGTKKYIRQVTAADDGSGGFTQTKTWAEETPHPEPPDGTAAGSKQYVRQVTAAGDGSGGFTQTYSWEDRYKLISSLDVNDQSITTTVTDGDIDLNANGAGLIKVTENNLSQVAIVTHHDIGTGANEIPINGYLGNLAYQDDLAISSGALVASLPTAPNAKVGQMARVTDGTAALTWGATVTGGGTTPYLVWFNGTNWTIIGA